MNYKSVTWGLVCAGLCWAVPSYAQVSFDFDSIDTLLTDNMLDEAAGKYSSVMLSFQPEQATRLGFTSANEKLTLRTPQQSAQMLAALRAVRQSVEQLDAKQLSPAKQIDRDLLLNALDDSIWQEEQNRFRTDPLYYAQALDAVYDLVVKPLSPALRQRRDLAARLTALPALAEQAKTNLLSPAPYLAQLAMEKAYYAYLSADEWEAALHPDLTDQDSVKQVQRTVYNAKQAVKDMFDLFKMLSQQESSQDFRLGQTDYLRVLQNRYQHKVQNPAKWMRELSAAVTTAQKNLTLALEPFLQPAETDEMTIVGEDNSAETKPVAPVKPAKKKKKSKNIQPLNAQDFYAAAKPLLTAEPDENPLQTLANDAQEALSFLIQQKALPNRGMNFAIAALPQYYAYTQAYLFVPPFGNQLDPKADFLLRVPSGNQTTQQELFNQDFNTPTRKLMIAQELVPGRYYQAQNMLQNSTVRRLYPAQSLQNGWSLYAKQLAKEQGYISLDDELLFFAWDEYLRALTAFVDAKLHTRQYSYADALAFLTQTHGVNETQAENILKQVTLTPGKAVSYQIGSNAITKARKALQSKQGKKFNEADFHAKLFQIGNIPPDRLEKELLRLYKQESKRNK